MTTMKADPITTLGRLFSSEEMAFSVSGTEDAREKFLPIKDLLEGDYLEISLTAGKDGFDCVAKNNETRYPSLAARTGWWGKLPECKQIGHGRVACPATDFNVLAILAMWGNRVRFGDEDAGLLFLDFLRRFQEHYDAARMRSKFKIEGKVPERPDWFLEHPDFPLSDYQLVSALSGINKEMFGLLLDPSLGKTCVAINIMMNEARMARLRNPKSLYCALVVCPRSVRYNWRTEIARFCTTPGQVTVLRGTALDRMKLLTEAMEPCDSECEWSIVICSYDTVGRTWPGFQMIPWDRAVLDESQLIKGYYSKRWKIFQKLRSRCARRMLLTGTFTGNTVMDAYSQLEFLGEGFSGFTDWKQFRKFYCAIERRNQKTPEGKTRKTDLVTGFKNMPFLQERLNRVCAIFTKKEVLASLPEKAVDVREVGMTERQTEIYVQMQQQIAVEIEAAEAAATRGERRRMTADNVLVRLLRLAQITSGFVTWDRALADDGESLAPKVIEPIEPSMKIEAVREIVKEHMEEEPVNKMLIWSHFLHDVDRICALLAELGVSYVKFTGESSDEERLEAERLFNDRYSGVRVFVGNPAAGGVGLNLRGYQPTDGGEQYASRVIYFAQGWSSIIRRQSEDRCHGRDRCRGQVRYTTLVVPGSVDEDIYERVMSRTAAAHELNDVRDLMRKVLNWVPEVEGNDNDDE